MLGWFWWVFQFLLLWSWKEKCGLWRSRNSLGLKTELLHSDYEWLKLLWSKTFFSLEYNIRCVYLHTCIWKRFVRASLATYTKVFVSTLTRQLASSHKRSVLLTKPEKKQLLNSAENSGPYMLCLECNISVILTAPETLYLQIQMTVANSTLWKDSKSQLVTCLWIQHHKLLSKIKTI